MIYRESACSLSLSSIEAGRVKNWDDLNNFRINPPYGRASWFRIHSPCLEWMLLTQQILRKPHVMWAVISGIFSHLPQFGSVFSRHPTSHNFFRAVGCSLNSNPLIILFAFTILSPDYILICFAPNDIFFSLTTIPTCNAKYPNINSHAVITSVLLPNFGLSRWSRRINGLWVHLIDSDADAPSASPNARSSSPVNYVSDDENQVRSIASQWQIMTFKKNIHFASWYMPWRPLRTHSWIWKAPKYSKFKSRLVNQCGWNQFWSAARQRCHQFRCRHRETPREIAEERHWL